MISGEDIRHIIQHPHDVKNSQLKEIEALIEKFPYSSSLYILQMIGLGKSNDLSFESKLKIAASNVSEREHLFALLNTEKIEEEEEVTGSAETITEDIEVNIQEDDDDVYEEVKEIDVQLDDEEFEIEETAHLEKGKTAKEKKGIDEPELAELEESIMTSVVENALNEINDLKDEDIEEDREIDYQEEEIEIEIKPEVKVKRPENLTFIEWLKYKQSVIEGEAKFTLALEKKKKKKNKKKKNKKEKKLKEGIKDAKSMSKKEINDLLDKFIEEEPSIPSLNKDFYNPSKNAKKSVEDSVDIVSETLAKIHMMQGNLSKAISVYKQLSLLYPEKRAFFADQIKKLKEKQK